MELYDADKFCDTENYSQSFLFIFIKNCKIFPLIISGNFTACKIFMPNISDDSNVLVINGSDILFNFFVIYLFYF